MEYSEYNDSELISLINESSEEAKDIIYEKYKYIIDINVRKYLIAANSFGIEYNDLYQDALVGFADALNSYKEEAKAALPTFITICVTRRLNNSILKASRLKNKIMVESLSLEHPYEQFKLPLKEILSDNNENNPLDSMTEEESLKELNDTIKEVLSESEYQVYELMISGLKYNDIALILEKEPKQIDNTIQRIKNKVKKILNERS